MVVIGVQYRGIAGMCELRGRNVHTIARREFGRKAYYRDGMILRDDPKLGGSHVLARVSWVADPTTAN